MIKNIVLIVGLLVIGCESKSKEITVLVHGALKEIMHNAAREGVVELSDIINREYIYGVGALEGLDGEILIWDSKLTLTRAKKGGTPTISNDAMGEKALLLVTASVSEWIDIPFDGTILESSLNDYIQQVAEERNLNISEPFPFILEGVFTRVKWHIISDPGIDGTHDDHMNKSWNRTDEKIHSKILGFYSTKHHAIFTHHSTNSHMHFYHELSGLSGHVDELILSENIILKLPK